MSTAAGDAPVAQREQLKADREERKRQRASQDSSKTGSSRTKDRTPSKEEKRKKKTDFSSSNGSAHKKPPSGVKRYDKVNIVEKAEATEKENKGSSANEGEKSGKGKLGSKFLDNLSKFESHGKTENGKEKSPFVRSYSTQQDRVKNEQSTFRRSYRPSRTTAVVEDPSILVRRSLRKERVLDSIAKFEKTSTTKTSSRKPPASPTASERKALSRPSSASSTKTNSSDSGSSASSAKSSTSRAQQALERHKNRMRKGSQTGAVSPGKPSSPAGKSRSFSSADTPTKTPTKSRLRNKDKNLTRSPSVDEPRTRKISVTKTPSQDDGDVVEITTVTEVVTPSKEKLDIVIKEKAITEEEADELIEKTDSLEYEPGDPRPLSVGDYVAMFSAEESKSPVSPEPTTPTSGQTPAKIRRKLPEVPKEAETKERKSRKKRSKKKKTEDGSGEPAVIAFKPQEVVVVETSPSFQSGDFSEIHPKTDVSDQKTGHFDIPDETVDQINPLLHNFNQNSSNFDQKLPTFEAKPKTPDSKPKFAQNFSFEEPVVSIKEKNENEPISLQHITSEGPIGTEHITASSSNGPISTQHLTMASTEEPISSKHEAQHKEPVKPLDDLGQGQSATEDEISTQNEASAEIAQLKKQYSVEEAIKALRKLSEEINTEPMPLPHPKKSDSTSEALVEDQEKEDLEIKSKKGEKKRSKKKKKKEERPTSLEIDEVLYVSTDVQTKSRKESDGTTPHEPSPDSKQLGELSGRSQSPSPKKTLQSLSKNLFSFESPESPVKDFTPAKSPTKTTEKSRSKTPTTPTSPQKSPISPTKTQKSPTKAPVSPIEANAATSPTKSPKSPKSTDRSTPTSPHKEISKSPRSKTPSPTKSPSSPTKAFAQPPSFDNNSEAYTSPKDITPVDSPKPKSPKISSRPKTPTSPVKQLETISLEEIEKKEARTVKMTGKRASIGKRYKKSWLDESDDDNVSLLSDAASDDLEIDVAWLGADSDDDDYRPKWSSKSTTKTSNGGGVQRTASRATDMLAMWEKKAAEPRNRVGSSPGRKISDIKVGSAKAAWEVKATQEHKREKSFEKDYKKEIEMERAKVTNGDSTPEEKSTSASSTPSHGSRERHSSSGWKPRASEEEAKEMQDIFNDRVAGKIQGAKAMFENLTQSPVRSPSFARSARKMSDEKPQVFDSDESSPVISRKSSIAENMSQESEDTEQESEHSPEIIEDAPKVDNMRALFENQAKQKQETRKHKPSLAEMVADDNVDCDITDVRSVKAMWESMDNRR